MNSDVKKPNDTLRYCRERQGWSQRKLAELVDTSEDMVSRWERGISKTSPFYQERLCTIFGKNAEELGFIEPQKREISSQINIMSNKPQLAHFSTPSNHVQPVVATQIPLLDQTMNEKLDHIESVINLAWEAWFAANPKQAAREITRLLPSLEKIIYTSHLSLYTLRASELAIRGHGLIGSVYLDSLQNDMALFHYTQAHKYAEEIRDKELSITYLALIGDVLRRQNKKQAAIKYMEDAKDKAIGATHATQGHILQLLAYTYADTGNEVDFDKTIQHATDLLEFTGEGRDAAKKEFNPFEIYEIQGKANRDLGRPLQAISFLDAAEKSLEKATNVVTPRFHALLAISRGQAYCDSGDLSLGVDLAMHGFVLANRCDSARQMNRVRKLLKKLENPESSYRGERKVGELKDLVYETYLHMNLDQ